MAREQGEAPTRPTPNQTPNYTWLYELQWYRRHFNCLLHVLLGGPLVLVFLARPYVSCCRNTAIMTITSAILGGLGITIGE
jgi:fatty-acid desaturase